MSASDRFCPECGTMQNNTGNMCPNCGQPVSNGEMFCSSCGTRMGGTQPMERPIPQPEVSYRPQPQRSNSSNSMPIIAATIAVLIIAIAAAAVIIINLNKDNNSGGFESSQGNYVQAPISTQSPTLPPEPVFDWVTASSTRGYDTDSATGEVVYYYPEFAVDGDMRTAWTPDRNKGSQPYITLNAHTEQYVSGISMTNGYCKSEKTYTRNRRITRVLIEYNGGSQTATFGIDSYRQMIDIPFNEPVNTDYITITVLDSHYGDWKDIAISEITVY